MKSGALSDRRENKVMVRVEGRGLGRLLASTPAWAWVALQGQRGAVVKVPAGDIKTLNKGRQGLT